MKFTGSKIYRTHKASIPTREVAAEGFWVDRLNFFRDKAVAKIGADKEGCKITQYDKFTFGDITKAVALMGKYKPVICPTTEPEGIYSAKRTLIDNIQDEDYVACHQLFGSFPRSTLMAGKQIGDYARYARSTPLGLYAFKEHHNINYMQWSIEEEEHPYLAIMLGLGLAHKRHKSQYVETEVPTKSGYADALDYRTDKELMYPDFTMPEDREQVDSCRRHAYSRGGGKVNLNYISKLLPDGTDDLDDTLKEVLNSMSSTLRDMALQGHACNSSHRVSDAMILHPINWDYLPRSYDVATTPRLRRL
jgi:hypothetical protein